MPDVAPAGPVAVAIDSLRTLIANTPFFQQWTGIIYLTNPDGDYILNPGGDPIQVPADVDLSLARVFTGELGNPILSIAIASLVITVETREPHQFNVDDVIVLDGASIGDQSAVNLAGNHRVVSVPSETTFTLATVLADVEEFNPFGAIALPAERPIVCLCEDENPLESMSIGTGGTAICHGAIAVLLEASISSAYRNDPRNALCEMRSAFGQFVQGLHELSGTEDYMIINQIETIVKPSFLDRAEQQDNTSRFERWQALLRVTWGLEG